MLYNLICPNEDCLESNEVETETPGTPWECSVCNAKPFSSLPTDEEGNLI